MRYKTLTDLYAAILKGEVETEDVFAMPDAGEFTVYEHYIDDEGEHDTRELYDGHYDDAMAFAAAILGIGYQHP